MDKLIEMLKKNTEKTSRWFRKLTVNERRNILSPQKIDELIKKIRKDDEDAIVKGCYLLRLYLNTKLMYYNLHVKYSEACKFITEFFKDKKCVNITHLPPEHLYFLYTAYLRRVINLNDYIKDVSYLWRPIHWQDIPWSDRMQREVALIKELPEGNYPSWGGKFFNEAERCNPVDAFSISYKKGKEILTKYLEEFKHEKLE